MPRPFTLFTGQWADLPLEVLAAKAAAWGYDGLELACWGDHFDVERALADDGYCDGRRALPARHGLTVHAVSNHLVGQAVCDRIAILHRGRVIATGPTARLKEEAGQPGSPLEDVFLQLTYSEPE